MASRQDSIATCMPWYSVAKSNAKFGHRLRQALIENATSSNVILSSFGLSSVLCMILHGAGGRTALELRHALGLLEEAGLPDTYAGNTETLQELLHLTREPGGNSSCRVSVLPA